MLSPVEAIIVNDSDLNTFLLSDMFRSDPRLKDIAGGTHIITNTRMLMRFLDEKTKAQPKSVRFIMLDYHLPGGDIVDVLPRVVGHAALASGAVLIGWSSDPDRADDFRMGGVSGFIAKTRGFSHLAQDILSIVESASRGEWLSLI